MTPDAGRPARCRIPCNAALCARAAQDATRPSAPAVRIAPGRAGLVARLGAHTLPRPTGRVPG